MSFLKDLAETLSSIFSDTPSSPSSLNDPQQNSGDRTMDGVATGNERTAYKLKGYFELAKEEIAKAVRAEEWGLADDAIAHYHNAQKILAEGISTPVPSYIASSYYTSVQQNGEINGSAATFSNKYMVLHHRDLENHDHEHEKVKSYRQKILKWQSQVSDRLQTLSRRAGGTSSVKHSEPQTQRVAASQSSSSARKGASLSAPGSGKVSSVTRVPSNSISSHKPSQESATASGSDPKLVEMINSVIVDRSPSVKWEDIAGLEKAKQALLEMVILPTKRKDLFTGLRRPARGLLLFGPPGTGKTMLAKAVASESQATFFNVSASSLTSKWVGEGEKLVKTLFMVAISRQPSVIFMDEIDSIMSTRTTNENEASRRLKSEFLVQFDGVTSNSDGLVIVIGATNKPQELDDAVLRRLVKRIYIPLPDASVRRQLLKHRLKGKAFSLPDGDLERLVRDTEGYSGSDLQALCEEAAMMPIRELGANILSVKANQVRGLRYGDFQKAMTVIRPSLQKSKWEELERWNQEFGAN